MVLDAGELIFKPIENGQQQDVPVPCQRIGMIGFFEKYFHKAHEIDAWREMMPELPIGVLPTVQPGAVHVIQTKVVDQKNTCPLYIVRSTYNQMLKHRDGSTPAC